MVTDELIGARLREHIDGLHVPTSQVDDVLAGAIARSRARRTRVRLGAAAAGVALAAGGVVFVLVGQHMRPQGLPAGPVPPQPAAERPLPLWTGSLSATSKHFLGARAFAGQAEVIPGDRPCVGVRLDDGRLVDAVWPTGYRAAVAGDGSLVLRDAKGVDVFRYSGRAAQPTRVHLVGRIGVAAPDGGCAHAPTALEVSSVAPERWANEPVLPQVPDPSVAWRGRAEALRRSLDAQFVSSSWYAGTYLNEAGRIVVAQVRPATTPTDLARHVSQVEQAWRSIADLGVHLRTEISDHPIADARRLADELAAYGRDHPDDLPVASAHVLASNTVALHVPNYQQDRVRGRLNRMLAQDRWRELRPERYGFAVVGDHPPQALPDWETPPPIPPGRFDLGLPTADADRAGVAGEDAFGPRTRVGGFLVRFGYDEPCWALVTPNGVQAIPRWPAGWRAGVEDTFVLRDVRDGVRAAGPMPWVTGEGRLGPGPTRGRCAGLPVTLDLGAGSVFGAVPPPADGRLPRTPQLSAPRQFAWAEQVVSRGFPDDDPAFGGVYWHPLQRVLVVQIKAGSTVAQQAAMRARLARVAPDPTLRWRFVVTDRSLSQGRRLAAELGERTKDDPAVRGGVAFVPDWGGTIRISVVPGQEDAVRRRLDAWFRGPLAHLHPQAYPVSVMASYQPGDPGWYDKQRR